MIEITESKIKVEMLNKGLYSPDCGAVVTFEGCIRNHNDSKEVSKLVYECYKPMALKVMKEIQSEALKKWNVKKVIAVHRIGHVPIGEVSVWIGVASAHRKEAFEACRFVIDEIKTKVPIWKQETYTDGTKVWVEACCH